MFVVIVNYRTAALAVQCLLSLVPSVPTLRGGKVIVADNASGDDSLPILQDALDRHACRPWVEILALPRNGGFAYGNNRAIEWVRRHDPQFRAVVLLNPDTVVRSNAIGLLLGFLTTHADAGIVGAAIEDVRGTLQRTAHRFPSPVGELEAAAQLGLLARFLGKRSSSLRVGDEPRACDWVSGACLAVRREVFNAIGLLDEGYFLYFEETDFCLRAKQAGWGCWFVPEARVVHFEGAATGIRDPRRRRPAYWFDSRRRFFAKRYGTAGLVLADLLWLSGRASLLIRRGLGLGGAPKTEPEPERFACDLVVGDAKAVLRGELRNL